MMRRFPSVLVMTLCAACVSQPTAPPQAGQAIVFSSDRHGNSEIYTMHPDGGSPIRLTRHGATDFAPSWSPDRKRIVFLSNREPGPDGVYSIEVYVMHFDGSGVRRLTRNDTAEGSPSFSPDGKKILYSTSGGESKIFLMNDDGTNVVQLTHDTWADSIARWSPDGTRIAYLASPNGWSQLYTMSPDGTNKRRVSTQAVGGIQSFAWSPDSKYIVYEYGEWPFGGIYRALSTPVVGMSAVQLVSFPPMPSRPVWSPDGERIALTLRGGGDGEIYTINASDGGDPRNITFNPAEDLMGDWK